MSVTLVAYINCLTHNVATYLNVLLNVVIVLIYAQLGDILKSQKKTTRNTGGFIMENAKREQEIINSFTAFTKTAYTQEDLL